MFGAHLSIAGSLANALREAKRLKMDCVQVFTKNQRQWRVPPLTAEQVAEWRDELVRLGWDRRSEVRDQKSEVRGQKSEDKRRESHVSRSSDARADRPTSDLRPLTSALIRTVSHNTYLINMASPDSALWEKSVTLQRVEIERCEELGIPCCVAHPGAHLGEPAPRNGSLLAERRPTRDERAGLKRIAKALNRIHRELPGYRTLTLLETTVGSGTNLGYCFEHLAFIRDALKHPERVGYCLDTCHITAAGYDMTTDEKAAAVLDCFNAICGFENLHAIHMNDSVGALGSRRDRHAHIGEGCCGKACFRVILNTPALAGVPKILETPKESDEKGVPMDVINIRRLKRLRRRTPPRLKPSTMHASH